MTVSVCLFACLSVREHISSTTCPIFTKCCMYITYVWGSVLH